MKKITWLPLAALVVGLAACSDTATEPQPDLMPQFELVNETLRVTANVNAEVYATFYVEIADNPGTTRYVLGSQKDDLGQYIPESANFPGKGKALPGECVAGKWFNPQDKPTTGSIDRPHPHCVGDVTGSDDGFRAVLEKISAEYKTPGGNKMLILGVDDGDDLGAKYVGNNQQGNGSIVAWAVREGTSTRVGQFTIDLTQFEDPNQGTGHAPNPDLFDCSLSGDEDEDGCLNKEVKAVYRHGEDGSGSPQDVWGKLYWFLLP